MPDHQPLTLAEWDALWRVPVHSGRLGAYRCSADPRLFVPQQNGAGWTVNMGYRRAHIIIWAFLAIVIAFVVGLIVFVARAP